MTSELKEEWELIVNQPDLYIYGAAKTAEKLYDFITGMGFKDHVKGFLVTDCESNVHELCGLPVRDIHDFGQMEANILVPHLGVYRRQISDVLNRLGFKHIYFVSRLMDKTEKEKYENRMLEDQKTGWELYNRKSESEKEKDAYIREQILNILREGEPDFGFEKPYQSLELIGLEGIRPTEYRIRKYGLKEILNSKDDVLDIGCNLGFLDISIAGMVHSVTGIEYDKSLIKAANLVKNYINAQNCTFYNGDFNDWCKNIHTKYDVVFSFAIHHWLDLAPHDYVGILNQLVKPHGYICFESHVYGADAAFDECCQVFKEFDYAVAAEKMIQDDGVQMRKYVLFQKMSECI